MLQKVYDIIKRDGVVSKHSLAMELETTEEKIDSILFILENQGLLSVRKEKSDMLYSCSTCKMAGSCGLKEKIQCINLGVMIDENLLDEEE